MKSLRCKPTPTRPGADRGAAPPGGARQRVMATSPCVSGMTLSRRQWRA